MQVKKRNGKLEPFDRQKIISALRKAFLSCNENKDAIEKIADEVKVWDGINIEDIQDQIEELLLDYDYSDVYKAFSTYRESHSQARFIRERLDYMNKYKDPKINASSASETDANANVAMKNVANLEGEVYKTTNRIIQRQRMKEQLNKLYPNENLGEQYVKDLEHHIIYTHDEASSPVLKPYCKAVTLYPLMMEGVGNIDGVTPSAPNDIQSFSGQVTNLVFLLSSQCKGAVACLHGSQKLIINSKEISIKEFVENNWLNPEKSNNGWEFCWTKGFNIFEDGKYVNIKRVFKKPYKNKIYKISSNKGFCASVSEDHKFKVLRRGIIQEIPAKELHLFDTVFVNNNIPIDFTGKEYKEGWIKGMLLGDGCLTQENMVQLSVNYDQEYYGDIFNCYSKEIYDCSLSQCSGHKCYQYERRGEEIYNKYISKLIGSNTFDKNIDSLNYSIEYLTGVLDGLLCADGGENHSINLALVNKGLINNIASILDMLRIPYSYKEVPEHDNKNTLYCLSISSEILKYTPNFLLKIPKNKKPKEVYYYSGWSRERNVKNKNNITSTGKNIFPEYKVDVITNIETFDNDDKFVYEIETDSHWYNCGGFITHNCGDYFIALNYYVVKEFGPDWYKNIDLIVTNHNMISCYTVGHYIRKGMKQFIYGINQPAGNRSYNSPFTNVSYYDKYYFESLFGEFYYPDGSQPQWEAIDMLQRMFMKLHRELRLIKPLTFPVSTIALVYDDNDYLDKEYKELAADEWAKGGSFFCYANNNPTSLASCCRVLNEMSDNTFSSTTGMTGVMTGSCNVITLNLNRIIQDWYRGWHTKEDSMTGGSLGIDWSEDSEDLKHYIVHILERVYKYHIAYKTMLYDMEEAGMFSDCNAGYIYIKKLYSTIGIIGYSEAAQYLGPKVSNNKEYKQFLQLILGTIREQNKLHSIKDNKRPFLFNTEAIPGEGLGVKLYKWDKEDGYVVPENQNLYNCYFYNPWTTDSSVLDKMKLHGREINSFTDGGQACHLNLDTHLNKEQYLKLLDVAKDEGCNYFTFNIPISECQECHHVVNAPIEECPICHSKEISYYTRIIGYLTKVNNWSNERQKEFLKRKFYH